MSHGFQADVIEHGEIAKELHLDPPGGDTSGILFLAKQLRLSDAQVIFLIFDFCLSSCNLE